uniref:Uncharacterized protein n=1 Tax=Strongyloides papillosus TaxID=174720 RepID=A0A0N5C1N1_STREA
MSGGQANKSRSSSCETAISSQNDSLSQTTTCISCQLMLKKIAIIEEQLKDFGETLKKFIDKDKNKEKEKINENVGEIEGKKIKENFFDRKNQFCSPIIFGLTKKVEKINSSD